MNEEIMNIGGGVKTPQQWLYDGVSFLGEVSSNDFISYSTLHSLLGVTQGSVNDDGNPWLMMKVDKRLMMIPKRITRSSISHNYLRDQDLLYPNRTVEIGGAVYSVETPNVAIRDPLNEKISTNNFLEHVYVDYCRIFGFLSRDIVDGTAKRFDLIRSIAPYTREDLGLATSSNQPTPAGREYKDDSKTHCLRRAGVFGNPITGAMSVTASSAGVMWSPFLTLLQ